MPDDLYESVCTCGRREPIPDGNDAFDEHMREHYRWSEWRVTRWVEINGEPTDRPRKEQVR